MLYKYFGKHKWTWAHSTMRGNIIFTVKKKSDHCLTFLSGRWCCFMVPGHSPLAPACFSSAYLRGAPGYLSSCLPCVASRAWSRTRSDCEERAGVAGWGIRTIPTATCCSRSLLPGPAGWVLGLEMLPELREQASGWTSMSFFRMWIHGTSLGGPVAETPSSQCMGPGVQSLIRELDPMSRN